MNKQALEAFNKVQDSTNYTLLKDTYKNSKTKFKAICDIHGEFSAFLKDFRKPNACQKCKPKKPPHNHIDETEARRRLNKVKDFTYGEYKGFDEDMEMFCVSHNKPFVKTPKAHLRYNGCDLCAKENLSNSKKLSNTDNINAFIEVYGDRYDYTNFKNNGNDTLSTIICKVHGSFEKTPHAHKSGQGCPKCALNIKTLDERKEQFIGVHNDRYDYSKMILDKMYANDIICNNHAEPFKFNQLIINHLQGKGCPRCGIITSKAEDELVAYIESLGVSIIRRDKKILNGKELDLYLPDYNLAIEYNGMVWHSRGTTFPKNIDGFDIHSHINKTDMCDSKGIQLLHIFESEWILNKDKWKSVIANKLNKNKHRLYARNTEFKEITTKMASDFCMTNHLQGKNNASLNYGLFHNSTLVSVMTFKKATAHNASYEMIRFCNLLDYSVIGSASKLLKNFRKIHKGKILSYANRRWSDGGLYRNIGFTELDKTKAGFCYFHYKDISKLYSRQKFQKHKLREVLDDYDNTITALANMFNNGYRQIFDSGNYVFTLD